MPTRIGQVAARIITDGRVSLSDVAELEKQINVDGRLSGREATELKSWFKKNADKFDTDASARLSSILGIANPVSPTPVTPTPVTPTPEPVVPTPTTVDISDPTVLTKHEGQVTYGKIEGGKLFVDGVHYDDVIQGSIANCYMVAAFSSVAHADPKLIENAIKDNGDGTFTVRFYEKSGYYSTKPVYVTVDADLPTSGGSSSKYANGRDRKELWVGLLEKAYAQWKGGYEQVGNGGISGEVITALTGKSTSYTGLSYSTADSVYAKIRAGAEAGRPMAAGTHGKDDGVNYDGTGVYAWHAYTVLGAVEENGVRYVQLRNPWGQSEHNPDGISDGKNDGIFKMKIDDFMKLYSGLTVSQ